MKLSDYELEKLYQAQRPEHKQAMARLLDEVRELREQAAERERIAGEEVEW